MRTAKGFGVGEWTGFLEVSAEPFLVQKRTDLCSD
jgi:hypothetical protein